MLLYRKLLPENATEKQREETRSACLTAICASKENRQRVRYLKEIIDGGPVVTLRNPNTYLFYMHTPYSLQNEAANAAVRKAQDEVHGFSGPSCALKPAIDYVSDGTVTAKATGTRKVIITFSQRG